MDSFRDDLVRVSDTDSSELEAMMPGHRPWAMRRIEMHLEMRVEMGMWELRRERLEQALARAAAPRREGGCRCHIIETGAREQVGTELLMRPGRN